MKLSHKLVTISAAALLGVSPVIGSAMTANTTVQAASTIHNTYGKNSKVETVKSVRFVDRNGKTTGKTAPKGGSYTIWNVKKIGNEYYLSIQTNYKYWLPASAVKGSVQYKDGSNQVTLKLNGSKNYTVTEKVSSKSTKKSTTSSKKTTTKKSTKTSSDSKKTSTKKKSTKKVTSTPIVAIRSTKVYDENGKLAKTYMGSKKWTTIGKGVKLMGHGTKTINGTKYYALEPGHYYIKASDVKTR